MLIHFYAFSDIFLQFQFFWLLFVIFYKVNGLQVFVRGINDFISLSLVPRIWREYKEKVDWKFNCNIDVNDRRTCKIALWSLILINFEFIEDDFVSK